MSSRSNVTVYLADIKTRITAMYNDYPTSLAFPDKIKIPEKTYKKWLRIQNSYIAMQVEMEAHLNKINKSNP